MKQTKSLWLGLGILLLVIAVVGGIFLFQARNVPDTPITGFVGGEKLNFMENPKVIRILSERYHLSVNSRKAGSIDMVYADHSKIDFLFPSSQTALELYEKDIKPALKDDMIFTTPIVMYTYRPVADALVASKMASQTDGVYRVDLKKLIDAIEADDAWASLGLDLFGKIMIDTTDPAKSNSGNMFSGLVANMLNDGRVIQADQVPAVAPRLKAIFDKLGYMSTSSSDLFSLFLRNGIGDKTITAGYENQLLEFSRLDKATWDAVKGEIVILYPEPTVWSTHILIALNDNGSRLLTALKDPELQKIAWEEHGFRTSVSGTAHAIQLFDVPGVAEAVTKTLPMPDQDATQAIIRLFE